MIISGTLTSAVCPVTPGGSVVDALVVDFGIGNRMLTLFPKWVSGISERTLTETSSVVEFAPSTIVKMRNGSLKSPFTR